MNRILAIGAHFDDVELGCGGTLIKKVEEGATVFKLTLTDNVTNFSQLKINVDFESSHKQSLEACKILGIKQIEPEKYFTCTELGFTKASMQMVEKLIFDYDIDTVFSHFTEDMQQDHVVASKISRVAARYCDTILYYQSNRYLLPEAFYPRVFVDITRNVEEKFKALSCYSGAHDRFKRLFEQTKLQNEIWGYQMKMTPKKYFAEAFVPHKLVI